MINIELISTCTLQLGLIFILLQFRGCGNRRKAIDGLIIVGVIKYFYN